MKRLLPNSLWLVLFVVIGIGLFLVLNIIVNPQIAQRPVTIPIPLQQGGPVKVTPDLTSDYVPTNTPKPGEVQSGVSQPSPTPIVISKVTNLADGLPDEKIYVYIIQHEDGTYEEYRISRDDALLDYKTFLGLKGGDVLIKGYPLIPLKSPSTPIIVEPIGPSKTK